MRSVLSRCSVLRSGAAHPADRIRRIGRRVRHRHANGTGWGSGDLYGGTSTQFAVTGRSNGSYQYRVSACSATACSAPGGVVSVSVAQATVPGTPVLTLPSSSGTGSFTVSWSAPSGATRYELQELAPGAWQWSGVYSGTLRSQALTRSNGTWTYHVRACNATACGDYGASVSIAVSIANAPSPPASFTVTPTTRGKTGVVVNFLA